MFNIPLETLALTFRKTPDLLGPLHGFGFARRMEHVRGNVLAVKLNLEHEDFIASGWGASENHRGACFCRLAKAGCRDLPAETGDRERTAAMAARFFNANAEDLA